VPVPTHDITCRTRAVNMQCDHCKEMVWFFSCTCGSKVFFKELGHPWEIHYCKEYFLQKKLELLVDIEKMTPEEVYNIITKREKLSGELVEERIWDIIEAVIGKRKSKLSIKNIEPVIGLTEVSGKIMELNNPINIFTRLGYDVSNIISKKLLGAIGNDVWAYAKIRSNANRKNECLEIEVLLTQKYLKENKLNKGDFVVGIAKGVKHAKGIIWVLNNHQVY
jgi:hypothetical protein